MPVRRRLTRATVVEAAAQLIDECPGHSITLAQVAQQLGVRTPSLYNHVDGLEDLHQEIAILGLRELGDLIGRAAIAKSGDEAIEAISRSYRQFAKDRPGLYLATQRAPQPDEVRLGQAAEQVLHILELILEPYGLSEKDQIHVIRGLRSLVHGFVSLELADGFGLPVDLDESFQRLVRMFICHLHTFGPDQSNPHSQVEDRYNTVQPLDS